MEQRMIRKSRVALLLALAAVGGAATAADLSLSVEIPQLPVAEYHRPYVAIWIEGADQTIAANLAVWYQVRGDHTKWLPDLRQWWRRGGRDLKVPVDGLTGATRPVGQHLLKFDAAQAPLAALEAGPVRGGGRSGARSGRPRSGAHSVRVAYQGRQARSRPAAAKSSAPWRCRSIRELRRAT